MASRALMFGGTGSDVGKSLIVAGLARVFAQRGLSVRPFKPQNMSNNAAVTIDGGEIGRAQALQARAAGIRPSVHMNPVLLKPQSETGAQVVVRGRVFGTARAMAYQALKPQLLGFVCESFAQLSAESDLVLVEGAGSLSEINLRDGDIANLGFARATGTPVIAIGDIDRGGVIASLVGTKSVMDADDAAMICGFIVNKFRGDPELFEGGMRLIAGKTGWAPLGLVPFFQGADKLPAEDAVALARAETRHGGHVKIVVLTTPRISNFDDFDPLKLEPNVDLLMLKPGGPIPADASLVILPGSKAVIADLASLRDCGWDIDLKAHVRRGGHVLGVCGGYQLLGTSISDPNGIEGPAGTVDGLGLLDVQTVLSGDKVLAEVSGRALESDVPFSGYEMHIGRTAGSDTARPLLRFDDGRNDGAVAPNGLVRGCYVHGLFADDRQRADWLKRIGATASELSYEDTIEATLDALADHLEQHVDCDQLLALAQEPAMTKEKPARAE